MFSDHNTIKLEISNRKTAVKSPNTWRLNNTFLNNTWIKEEISQEDFFLKFETNENGNTTYQIPWDPAKTILRGKFMAINTYIKKLE